MSLGPIQDSAARLSYPAWKPSGRLAGASCLVSLLGLDESDDGLSLSISQNQYALLRGRRLFQLLWKAFGGRQIAGLECSNGRTFESGIGKGGQHVLEAERPAAGIVIIRVPEMRLVVEPDHDC